MKIRSFRTTLLLMLTLAALIPALLAGLPFAWQMLSREQDNAHRRLTFTAGQAAARLQGEMAVFMAKADTLAMDSDITHGGVSHLLLTRVDRRLTEFLRANPLASAIYYFDPSGHLKTAAPAGMDFQKHLPFRLALQSMLAGDTTDSMLMVSADAGFIAEHRQLHPDQSFKDSPAGSPFLFVLHLVRDFRNRPMAGLAIAIPAERLGPVLRGFIGPADRARLTLNGQEIIAVPYAGQVEDNPAEIRTGTDLSFIPDGGPGKFRLSLWQPEAIYREPLLDALGWLTMIFLLLVLAFSFAGNLAARWLLRPLRTLAVKVQDYSAGRYRTPRPPVGFAEFEEFLDLLEEMAARIQEQMDEVARRRAQEARLEKARVESELSALQFQVNPHFLFNALNSVVAMIPVDPVGASDMLVNLAALYQKILEASRQSTIPLDEEMTIVRHYVALQKQRFGPRLEYDEDLPERTDDLWLPGMLIQTLVENAVKHGVEKSRQGGRVRVEVLREEAGQVVLRVSNTGKPLHSQMGRKGVGLANTRSRLQALYGDAWGFDISRGPGVEKPTVVRVDFSGARL